VQRTLDNILTRTTLRDLLRTEEEMGALLKERAALAPEAQVSTRVV
jgi:hypothetical protein